MYFVGYIALPTGPRSHRDYAGLGAYVGQWVVLYTGNQQALRTIIMLRASCRFLRQCVADFDVVTTGALRPVPRACSPGC